MNNYPELKLELTDVVSKSSNWLFETESKEVSDFIEVGEFGLAYETLCDIIIEEKKVIPDDIYSRLVKLGEQMEFDKTIWLKLKSFVSQK